MLASMQEIERIDAIKKMAEGQGVDMDNLGLDTQVLADMIDEDADGEGEGEGDQDEYADEDFEMVDGQDEF